MEKGVVKWFNNAKGYGFILSEKDNQDVFVHYSSIDMNGYRTLRTGQAILFDSIAGPKGLHATAIRMIDEVEGNVKDESQSSSSDIDTDANSIQAAH